MTKIKTYNETLDRLFQNVKAIILYVISILGCFLIRKYFHLDPFESWKDFYLFGRFIKIDILRIVFQVGIVLYSIFFAKSVVKKTFDRKESCILFYIMAYCLQYGLLYLITFAIPPSVVAYVPSNYINERAITINSLRIVLIAIAYLFLTIILFIPLAQESWFKTDG